MKNKSIQLIFDNISITCVIFVFSIRSGGIIFSTLEENEIIIAIPDFFTLSINDISISNTEKKIVMSHDVGRVNQAIAAAYCVVVILLL